MKTSHLIFLFWFAVFTVLIALVQISMGVFQIYDRDEAEFLGSSHHHAEVSYQEIVNYLRSSEVQERIR